MISEISREIKPLDLNSKLEVLRDIRAIVAHDWRIAQGRGDQAEAALCQSEYREIQAEIDGLTGGRGW